jgi:hypothetical protein
MEQGRLLIAAMAERCKAIIQAKPEDTRFALQQELRPKHLLWMCHKVIEHADDWPAVKLHRWIGFVQCGMMANLMLDLAAAKAMFSEAKKSYGEIGNDLDLVDHLNPESSFDLEIGGQG